MSKILALVRTRILAGIRSGIRAGIWASTGIGFARTGLVARPTRIGSTLLIRRVGLFIFEVFRLFEVLRLSRPVDHRNLFFVGLGVAKLLPNSNRKPYAAGSTK